jgi:hypothetical protein
MEAVQAVENDLEPQGATIFLDDATLTALMR